MSQPLIRTGASVFFHGARAVGVHFGWDFRIRGVVSTTTASFSPSPMFLVKAMCQSTWGRCVHLQFVDSPLPLFCGLMATIYPTTVIATPSNGLITASWASVQSWRCLGEGVG